MRLVLAGSLTGRTALLIISEHLLVVLCVMLAAFARITFPATEWRPEVGLLWRASLIAGVLQVCLHLSDLYDLRRLSERRDTVVALIRALGCASVVLAFIYYWAPTLVIGRGVFVISSVVISVAVAGWRLIFNWWSLRMQPVENLLIVGTNGAAVDLARELFDRRQELGVNLVGFVDQIGRAHV